MDEQKKETLDFEAEEEKIWNKGFILFAALHLLCCGLPLLVAAGLSLNFVRPVWPTMGGVLTVLGIAGFAWYLKRRCATCAQ